VKIAEAAHLNIPNASQKAPFRANGPFKKSRSGPGASARHSAYMLFVMTGGLSIIERAYQLARSGECANLTGVKDRLRTEGYANVNGHLSGPVITRALRRLCTQTRAKSEMGVKT
jgi:hypothetical protein